MSSIRRVSLLLAFFIAATSTTADTQELLLKHKFRSLDMSVAYDSHTDYFYVVGAHQEGCPQSGCPNDPRQIDPHGLVIYRTRDLGNLPDDSVPDDPAVVKIIPFGRVMDDHIYCNVWPGDFVIDAQGYWWLYFSAVKYHVSQFQFDPKTCYANVYYNPDNVENGIAIDDKKRNRSLTVFRMRSTVPNPAWDTLEFANPEEFYFTRTGPYSGGLPSNPDNDAELGPYSHTGYYFPNNDPRFARKRMTNDPGVFTDGSATYLAYNFTLSQGRNYSQLAQPWDGKKTGGGGRIGWAAFDDPTVVVDMTGQFVNQSSEKYRFITEGAGFFTRGSFKYFTYQYGDAAANYGIEYFMSHDPMFATTLVPSGSGSGLIQQLGRTPLPLADAQHQCDIVGDNRIYRVAYGALDTAEKDSVLHAVFQKHLRDQCCHPIWDTQKRIYSTQLRFNPDGTIAPIVGPDDGLDRDQCSIIRAEKVVLDGQRAAVLVGNEPYGKQLLLFDGGLKAMPFQLSTAQATTVNARRVRDIQMEGDRVAYLDLDGNLWVYQGSWCTGPTLQKTDVAAFQLAGPDLTGTSRRIGVLTRDGRLQVNEGADLTEQPYDLFHGAEAFQLRGSRVVVKATSGVLYAKEGGLNTAWQQPYGDHPITKFELEEFLPSGAVDNRMAQRIGILNPEDHQLYVAEGNDLSQLTWVPERGNTVDFKLHGARIAALEANHSLYVKDGHLDEYWGPEITNVSAFKLAGSRIAVLRDDGHLWVQEGRLDTPLVDEYDDTQEFDISGDRIAAVSAGTAHFKEGTLNEQWCQ